MRTDAKVTAAESSVVFVECCKLLVFYNNFFFGGTSMYVCDLAPDVICHIPTQR